MNFSLGIIYKMSEKYAPAILHWRQYAGPSETWPSATVSTMLFACERWMKAATQDQATREQVLAIKAELDAWVADRDAPKPS